MMDEAVIRAMLKWPEVPAVYGWLCLGRRGRWRIRVDAADPARFELVGNAALEAFICRNYSHDEVGRWFFQNGPQRVYVRLDYAPLVFRLEGELLIDNCGQPVGDPKAALLDEEGSLVLQAGRGVGILDDRDLGCFADALDSGYFVHRGIRLLVSTVASGVLETRFGFVRNPGA